MHLHHWSLPSAVKRGQSTYDYIKELRQRATGEARDVEAARSEEQPTQRQRQRSPAEDGGGGDEDGERRCCCRPRPVSLTCLLFLEMRPISCLCQLHSHATLPFHHQEQNSACCARWSAVYGVAGLAQQPVSASAGAAPSGFPLHNRTSAKSSHHALSHQATTDDSHGERHHRR